MKYLFTLFFAFILTGCVSETNTNPPSNTVNLVTTGNINDIVKGKTYFAWHPTINANYLNSEIKNNVEEQFVSTLKEELENKGYIYTNDITEAEFYVGYGLGVDSQISDTQILAKTGLLAGIKPSTESSKDAQKASVFIAVFLPNHIRHQWSVLAQGYSNQSSDKQTALRELIDFMLGRLNSKAHNAN